MSYCVIAFSRVDSSGIVRITRGSGRLIPFAVVIMIGYIFITDNKTAFKRRVTQIDVYVLYFRGISVKALNCARV